VARSGAQRSPRTGRPLRPICDHAMSRCPRRFALRPKNSAWLAMAETLAG